jgi:hypothetical protein
VLCFVVLCCVVFLVLTDSLHYLPAVHVSKRNIIYKNKNQISKDFNLEVLCLHEHTVSTVKSARYLPLLVISLSVLPSD